MIVPEHQEYELLTVWRFGPLLIELCSGEGLIFMPVSLIILRFMSEFFKEGLNSLFSK